MNALITANTACMKKTAGIHHISPFSPALYQAKPVNIYDQFRQLFVSAIVSYNIPYNSYTAYDSLLFFSASADILSLSDSFLINVSLMKKNPPRPIATTPKTIANISIPTLLFSFSSYIFGIQM